MKRKLSIITVIGLCVSLFAALPAYADISGTLRQVSSAAGSGLFAADNGTAASASFRAPTSLTIASDGSILISDTKNHLIRQVKNGRVSTFAGITFDLDAKGMPIGGLENGAAEASVFQNPSGLALDGAGNVYIADSGNNVIRKMDPSGKVTTLAGDPIGAPGDSDGRGSDASFNYPTDVAVTAGGTVYVADTLNHAIRRILPNGQVTTLNALSTRAAEIYPGLIEFTGDFKDGKLAEALFNEPSGLALDAKGNLYVSDSGNHRIRYIDFAAGTVTTVAGNNQALALKNSLYAVGDYVDGAAADAKFDFPKGIAVTAEGGLLIADSMNHAVRYLYKDKVSTIAGAVTGEAGNANGPEKSARLQQPTDVAIAANGDLYVVDSYNNIIRRLTEYRLPASIQKDGHVHVVNGSSEISFDAKPQLINGRVMVPLRAVAESLGYDLQTPDNEIIILKRDSTTVQLTIGSKQVRTIDESGAVVETIDVTPYIENDRTYVPVRFISEQLGKQVDWNQEFKTVVIR